jgi:preprotein translocase subunit SecA
MFKNIAKAIGGDPQKREIERLSEYVHQINQLETDLEKLSGVELRAKTDVFRKRLNSGETLDDLLTEAFAVVREASKRTIGLRHFDIQLIGGIVMHEGMIAEMRTGEGKTLVATLPLYLNALAGKGTHLVTVNDYLARRDARWMAPIYHLLGLSVGVLQASQRTNNARDAFLIDLDIRSKREEDDQLRLVPRREAYSADITYGTNNEFGFDYLRDNLIMDIRNRVQRGHNYTIIDEVDNILIDEARTPLIISGPASEDVEWYSRMAAIVKQLDPEDYDFDEKDRSIALTEIGEIHVENLLKIPLRDPERPEDITPEQARLLGYLEQALRAELLFKKNKDYIVQNKQVVIVDEFTGRLMPGRRWSEGLHQAVEAKEGVKVNPENITHATITLQNYFRKYKKLSGMTGTALTEAEEFSTIYDLDVLEIPTNLDFEASRPDSPFVTHKAKDDENYTYVYYASKNDADKKPVYWKRKDYPDVVYRTEEAKLRAISMEIIKFYIIGRPQLIGTTSIEHSERLSVRLQADMLRRLLTVILIRGKWMVNNNVDMLERAVPELEPLNQPLSKLRIPDLRQFTQKIGIQLINLENPENVRALLDFFNIAEIHQDRLLDAIKGGINHRVLNALKHDQESQIIESAGAFGAVTIATNMAGRGVDIKLGGEIQESILSDVRKYLSQSGVDPYGKTNSEMADELIKLDINPEEDGADSIQVFLSFLEQMRRVRKAGGLHVIGSERHEARRIDNQLRGRSGRQGDPGSSRFYLSLEDDLMRMFGGERAENMMRFFKLDPSIPLESKIIGRLVEQAQERVEGYNFDVRKHLLDYDDILNDQRERIYTERDLMMMCGACWKEKLTNGLN